MTSPAARRSKFPGDIQGTCRHRGAEDSAIAQTGHAAELRELERVRAALLGTDAEETGTRTGALTLAAQALVPKRR